ncbi:hypothetical protein LEN26_013001 [Aphanomyces euteiches]|nr:hypothetical protein LEN26_013001 [Aphanomyces euteiches]
MALLIREVEQRHASVNTILHALYGYYFLGVTKGQLARLYRKHVNTIDNWIKRYEDDGSYERKSTARKSKFSLAQKQWIIDYYDKNPLAFLDEAKSAFQLSFGSPISVPTVWQILRDAGYTRKVLERRAIHIKLMDIIRVTNELSSIDWCQQNAQFLDEASFDNRGMLRKRGYSLKGTRLAFRGEFNRKARVSVLCWIGIDGVVEIFHTEGSFDRAKFFDCCRIHAHSGKTVRAYPGPGSVWILDGAKIHCHPNIIYYLRSIGIVPLFLPAYCPFFNPIEYLFGLVKQSMKRQYVENSREPLERFVMRVLLEFENFDMQGIFEHCGYTKEGVFDPTRSIGNEKISIAKRNVHDVDELLDFTQRDGSDEE